MLKSIVNFIEDEYKGIIATIIFLLFILIISMIMSLISQEFCDLEDNLNLNLEENSSCNKMEMFETIIDTLIYVFLFIMSIASIYGLYKLFEEILDYFS